MEAKLMWDLLIPAIRMIAFVFATVTGAASVVLWVEGYFRRAASMLFVALITLFIFIACSFWVYG